MAEKDFRVKKGLAVEGTGNSTITGKLAIGSEETGGPSTSHSNMLRISGDTNTDGIAKTSVPQLLVKTQNNGQDALVTIRGRRNGSAVSNQAVLQFGNHDDNATGGGSQVEFSALGAIAGRVSDPVNNIGDMVFVTYADGATASDRMIIKNDGKVGIGTTAPEALLDVNTGSGIAIQMGADVNAATLTNDTRKYGRFATPHYHNAEEPIGLIVGDSDGTDNIVNIGGGSNAVNAATIIRFWSAASDDTITGTERMRITSAGDVGIGTTSPSYDLHVVGSGYFTDDLRVGAETPGKITLNGNDAFVQGQFEASGTAGSYIYSLALGGETPTTTSGEILGAKATFSGSSAGDYEALKLVNTNDTDNAAVTALHMSNLRGVDSAFFLEHDAYGNTKMFTGQGSNVATSAGSDMNLGITILESGGVRISDAFQFPTSIGSSGQVLKVPSSGSVLEWANDNSAAGGASTLNQLTDVLISNDSIFLNNFGSAPSTGTLSTAEDNIAIGYQALSAITSADDNIALGIAALAQVTEGSSNIALGHYAGNTLTTGEGNILIGYDAGRSMDVDADNFIAIGQDAAREMKDGQQIAIGANALKGSSTTSNNTGTLNTAIGGNTLMTITSGSRNVALGITALTAMTTGDDNVGIGNSAGANINTGHKNIAIGFESLASATTNDANVAIGYHAARSATAVDASNNVAIGAYAGEFLDTNNNVAVGYESLHGSTTSTDNTGLHNTAVGYRSMTAFTTGSYNTVVGADAGRAMTTALSSVAVGHQALETVTTGNYNTAVGESSMGGAATGAQHNATLGYQAGHNLGASRSIGIGAQAALGSGTVGNNTGNDNIGVGYRTLYAHTSGSNNVGIGHEAGYSVTTGDSNVGIGHEALHDVTTGTGNVGIGHTSVDLIVDGDYNIGIGYATMGAVDTDIDYNIALGYQAGNYLGSNHNIALGYRSLFGSSTATDNTGVRNIGIGYEAAKDYTTGQDNVAIGFQAMESITTGSTNVAIGDRTLDALTTGSNNIAIGQLAGSTTSTDMTGGIFLGQQAGLYMDGDYNIGIGSMAVEGSSTTGNNTGNYNIGIGYQPMINVSSGTDNIGLGQYALQDVTTGNQNIGIGHDAGKEITTGTGNIVIGKDSGDSIVDGNYNVLIGEDAGQDITSGSHNLIIHAGNVAANAPLSATASEQLRISSDDKVWFYGYSGNLYLGRVHLQKLPSSGTDAAGTGLEIGGGAGTGTGTGGDLKLQYAPAAGSTGSSVNSHADALTVHGDTGNVTIHNNLIVSGDSITVNAETITTEEAMLSMGIGQTATDADALDFGFYGTYDVGDTQKFRGVFADASASGKFKFFKDLEVEPTTTVNTGGTGFALADVKAATFEGNLTGNVTGNVTGNLTGNATGSHSGTLAGNASTATTATNVVVSANNSTDETIFPVFVDGATGTQGLETDTAFTYNPSTGMLTATGFTGALTGNASTATTAGGLSSTLAVSSGGTGATTLTSNAVLTGNGTNAVQAESNFTYNSNNLIVKGNDGTTNSLTDEPIVLVRPILTNSRDATLKIQGARNGSTTANTATLLLSNQDDNLSDDNEFNHLGAIVGRVTDTTDNHGDMHFLTFSDGATANETMTLTGAGNVGIGTTSPDVMLDIEGTGKLLQLNSGNNSGTYIGIANTRAMVGYAGGGLFLQGGFDKHLIFAVNNGSFGSGEVARFDKSTGNLGIGTTAPDQKLHVEGSILADAYNFATTTLASNYTDGETSLVLTDASQFPTAGSGTINGVAFTWTNKSSNTLTVPDLDASYTAGVTVVADTGLFFRDGFENVAQPSVTVYDRANSGASRDDLSINANSGIRFRLSNESQMQLTADQLSLTTGNQGAAAIFGFRDRVDMGIKSNTSYSVGVLAPDNVFIQTDSNNNGSSNYIDFGHGSNVVGSAESMMRIVMDGTTGPGKVGIGTTSPRSLLDVRGAAGSPGHLSLSTAETTVVDGDILGRIDFIAPDEADGTDSTALAASIYAEADDTFAADNNKTDIVFATGSSEAATEKMRLLSTGQIELSGTTLESPADTNHVRLGFQSEVLRIDSNEGYVQVGCQNTTYCHFVTNRGKFYFNRELVVNEGIVASYDEDLKLQRVNTTADQIQISEDSQTFTVASTAVMGLTSSQVTIDGSLTLKERASAPADNAGYGQLWVKSDGDGELYFTDDNGTDIQLTDDGAATGGGGGSGAVSAVANGSNNRIATFSSADALNGEANLTFDGSTLALAGKQTITVDDTVSEAFKVTITDTDSTADSTPFVVDGNGRVGIGTASPLTDMALTLNGDGTTYEGLAFQSGGSTKWKLSTDGAAFYHDSQANTLDYNIRLRDSSGNYNTMNLNADTTGTIKMGLGVSPVALLHVKADSSATSQTTAGSANITIEQDGTGDAALNFLLTGVQRWTMGIDNSDSDKFKIQTGATSLDGTSHVPAMAITTAGNVGIGTTAPQSSLHVSSGTSGDAVLILEADTDNNNETDQPYIVFEQDGGVQNSAVGLTSGNNTDNNALMLSNSVGSSGVQAGIVFKTGTTDGYTNAVERMRILPAGGIKFNDAYTFPTSDGSADQVLQTDGAGNLSFATVSGGGSSGSNGSKPAVFMDSGNTNLDQTERTIPFDTEVLDPSSNYSLGSDGHIRITEAGFYEVSYSIPINDDSTNLADRTRVFAFAQTSSADAFSSTTTIAQSRAQVYTREASGGSGLSATFIYEHTANDYIRIRIDQENNTNLSTETNQSQISIRKLSSSGGDTFVIVGEESDNYVSSEAAAGNANGFIMSYGNGAQNTTKSSSGSDFGVVIPTGCTLSRIDITFGNQGSETNSSNQTLTVFKNRSASTTTMTYNASGSGGNAFVKSFSSLSGNGLSYAAGDTFNIRATGLAGYGDTQVGPARMTAYFTVD